MTQFIHFIGILFLISGFPLAFAAIFNHINAMRYPKDMFDDAWPYVKKAYIYLGIMILCLTIGSIIICNF